MFFFLFVCLTGASRPRPTQMHLEILKHCFQAAFNTKDFSFFNVTSLQKYDTFLQEKKNRKKREKSPHRTKDSNVLPPISAFSHQRSRRFHNLCVFLMFCLVIFFFFVFSTALHLFFVFCHERSVGDHGFRLQKK